VKIRFTPEALIEFSEILEYLKTRSPGGARNVSARVKAVLTNLSDYPLSGTLTDMEQMRRIKVQHYPYLIFYRVEEQEIIILGIRHAARDTDTMPDHT
jgi:toxin ParE1/3/4